MRKLTLDITGAVIGTSTMLTALKGNLQLLAASGMVDQRTAAQAIADIDAIRAAVFAAIIPNATGHDWLIGLCGYEIDGSPISPEITKSEVITH